MDEFNNLVEIVKGTLPMVGSGVQALVGGFVSAMFLRGNTNRTEFEKIKVGKIEEALDDLIESRELTLTELVKCKNILKIAEKVDQINREKYIDGEPEVEKDTFDFDWFLRFFESAGYISNEDMQNLWARILDGEMQEKGAFSLRTLETLRNMNASEANLFANCAELKMISPYNEYFLLNSDESLVPDEDNIISGHRPVVTEDSDLFSIMATVYGINTEKIRFLEQCGLLSSIFVTSTFSVTREPIQLFNDAATIVLNLKAECEFDDFEFEFKGFRFSQSALELFSVVNRPSSIEFILDFARLIERTNSFMEVRVYKQIGETKTEYIYDDEHDILHDIEYIHITRLPNLDEVL